MLGTVTAEGGGNGQFAGTKLLGSLRSGTWVWQSGGRTTLLRQRSWPVVSCPALFPQGAGSFLLPQLHYEEGNGTTESLLNIWGHYWLRGLLQSKVAT